jgi:hypothetical protein
LVICARFIKNPLRGWLRYMTNFGRPPLFRISPPRFVLERFLIGVQAPRELRDEVRRTFKVRPGPARLPIILESATQLTAAEDDNSVGSTYGPEHAGPFQPTQGRCTTSLNYSGAHE